MHIPPCKYTFFRDNVGINSIIPTVLNFSIHGYNYCLPDMIGGNGYNGRDCEKELFLRWMQVGCYSVSSVNSILHLF